MASLDHLRTARRPRSHCCYYPPGIPLATDGLVKIPNKNIHDATEKIVSINDWPIYQSSLVSIPFKFLKDSQNALLPFSGILFSQLLVGEHLRQLCTLTSLHDSSCLDGIKKLCKEANHMFNTLNVSKEWNIPQKHCIDICFYYGDPDHGVPKYPTPIIHKRIAQATFELSQGGGVRGGPWQL